jgi:hypothetical protein
MCVGDCLGGSAGEGRGKEWILRGKEDLCTIQINMKTA